HLDPGPVEQTVEAELAGLPAAQLRPSLAAVATAMARILDGRVPTPKPAAAKSWPACWTRYIRRQRKGAAATWR
ncbi:MAG TPA: hypothetical protein VGF65_04550, partial [Mycobacterium sp.]